MGESVSSSRLVQGGRAAILLVLLLGVFIGVADESLLSRFGFASTNNQYMHGARSRATSITSDYYAKVSSLHNSSSINTNATNESTSIELPSLTTTGGIIIFLHVPKTGGTTIRRTYQNRDHVTYLFSNRRDKYDTLVPRVNEWVQTGPSNNEKAGNSGHRIGILEIHARNNPTFLSICDQLHQWKATAKEHKVPFFAFTVLREPERFGLSYFNYYHGMRWEKRRFEFLPSPNMTDANFIRTMHSNPQCLFLARSEQAYQKNFPELRQNLTRGECNQAYDCLRQTMDWIGTTERLINETLPLLHQLIDGKAISSQRSATTPGHPNHSSDTKKSTTQHENTGPKLFGRPNMTEESQTYLTSMTEWDQEMYRNVLHDYDFSRFALSVR